MPLNWPDGLYPQAANWGMTYNNRVFASTLTNAQDVIALPGAYWQCTLTFGSLSEERERLLTALLGRMQGMFQTCKVPTFCRERSDDIGAPVVILGNANAYSVTVGGIMSGLGFRAGDYITIADQLFEVVEDATASEAGQALLVVNKRLRAALPPGTPVEYKRPYAVMRLDEDTYSMSRRQMSSGGSIKLREAF